MKLELFDYDLPKQCIAQVPAAERDESRLLVMKRSSGTLEDRRFRDLPGLLMPGDLVVVNDTKVIPARLVGRMKGTGARVEVLLEEEVSPLVWMVLAKPAKRLMEGAEAVFGNGNVTGRVVEKKEEGRRLVEFQGSANLLEELYLIGEVPLPPYIRRGKEAGALAELDRERYQTVYAREPGAVAAPTAGLHFTKGLLEELSRRGVRRTAVTLHVGPGTFSPVRVEDVTFHKVEEERYRVSEETAGALNSAMREGSRIVAVGTSTVRVLETAFGADGIFRADEGRTGLTIRPGYRFRTVGALITNFHPPGSTPLLVACAFAGREEILAAYRKAIGLGYRFASYGDAMLIL